jgi:UDP-glucose 4,6-dehydratase
LWVEFYIQALSGVNGVTLLDIPAGAVSSYWIFSFHILNKVGGCVQAKSSRP